MSACLARTEKEQLRCTLLPAGGTAAFWTSCCAWVQRSWRTTGGAPLFMMLQRMGSWRLTFYLQKPFMKCRFGTHSVFLSSSSSSLTSQCCKVLLVNGANPADKDIDGFTAADLAEYNGHSKCARYLRGIERTVSPLVHVSSACPVLPDSSPAVCLHGKLKTQTRRSVNSKHLEGLGNSVTHFLDLLRMFWSVQACSFVELLTSTQPDCTALKVKQRMKAPVVNKASLLVMA